MANIVCQDGTIQYESMEILGNDSNFLKKLLMDTCCNATIIIPDFRVSTWDLALKFQSKETVSVTSDETENVSKLLLELGVSVSGNTENIKDCHLVDPETGFVKVSFIGNIN